MIPTPEINFNRTPVTLILAALALALEIISTLDPERRVMYLVDFKLGIWSYIWMWEIWRPFTSAVLHINFIHAIFNVYWLAVFGPTIENWLGSYKTLALIVLLAYVSSLAQYVYGNWLIADIHTHGSGVGLSGVVYGLFGLLWVGSWYRTELRLICNPQTVQLFIAWFFFCIVVTYLDWMSFGNFAHAAGWAQGMLLGMAIFKKRQRLWWASAAALFAALMLGTLIAAPGHAGYEDVRAVQRHNRGVLERREELRRQMQNRDAPFQDPFQDGLFEDDLRGPEAESLEGRDPDDVDGETESSQEP